MSSKRHVFQESGEIVISQTLSRKPDDFSYDDFQEELQVYTENEDILIKSIPKAVSENAIQEVFRELQRNFKMKDDLIRKRIKILDTKIQKLKDVIKKQEGQTREKYKTELNKLELSKLDTFRWLLSKELKQEELNKQEALKVFMTHCVNNKLDAESPDQ